MSQYQRQYPQVVSARSMSSLVVSRHQHKKWTMFHVTNIIWLLILHLVFLCNQHLCDNGNATDPDSILLPKKHHYSSPSLERLLKVDFDLKGRVAWEIQDLKYNLVVLLDLQCLWQRRALALGPCSKQNLAKLFPHNGLKQIGRIQRNEEKQYFPSHL